MSKPKEIRLEGNWNLDCSAQCPACDRCVTEFPDRKDHVTVEQIDAFFDQLRRRKDELRVTRLKIVGGEFLVHPQFREIYERVCAALDEDLLGFVKISTNCVSKVPSDIRKHPKIKWCKSPLKNKLHLPFLYHPKDIGQKTYGFCSHPWRCGMSMSAKGFLPCSPAIMIAGGFDLEHLYKQEIPTEPWGESELCSNCVYSVDRKWKRENLAFEHFEATPTWEKALRNYAAKEKLTLKLPVGKKATLIPLPMAAA